MSFFSKIGQFIKQFFFNPKWTCNVCGKEIFDGKYFCDDCEKELPFNDGAICEHCGRKLKVADNYCTTCKGKLVSFDRCRSVFTYDAPINKLIKNAKYDGKKYLLELFASYLSTAYAKHFLKADFITFIPMTEKSKKKRGYNQSQELSNLVGEKLGVQVIECLRKTKETDRQATLNSGDRFKNLVDAFKIIDKKVVLDKSIVVIDDVTTTGATAETVAKILKKAGAKSVYLLTVASVPPKDGY